MYISHLRLVVLALPFALLLTACEILSPQFADKGRSSELPFKEYPLRMMVGGAEAGSRGMPKNVNDFSSLEEFRNALMAIDPALCTAGKDLGECLRSIRKQDNRGSTKFSGLAGLTGQAFLRAAQSSLTGNGFQAPNVTLVGKIQQYCLHDPSLDGYAFDKNRKTLRFCVVVKTVVQHPGANQADPIPVPDPETTYQYYHVEVARDVAVDDGANGNANDVFPAAAAKTGIVIPETKVNMFTPPLDHKLYAWGRKIRIMTFWETEVASNGNPDWDQGIKLARRANGQPPIIPPSQKDRKRLREYFKEDDDACIDMMFHGPPPSVLDPNVHLPGVAYCLGRCKYPEIVNTR